MVEVILSYPSYSILGCALCYFRFYFRFLKFIQNYTLGYNIFLFFYVFVILPHAILNYFTLDL